MAVDVFKLCGCRDPQTKKRLEKACPRLCQCGHGTWYFEGMVSTMAGRHERARRGGFPTKWGRLPSPSTLHRIRATLRSALNAAIREGLIRDNPARFVELPTPRRPQAQVWTEHRVRRLHKTGERFPVAVWTVELLAGFLRFVADDRLYAMWWLIALPGLRRGEAGGLRWVDVETTAGLPGDSREEGSAKEHLLSNGIHHLDEGDGISAAWSACANTVSISSRNGGTSRTRRAPATKTRPGTAR
jgi:integrase